MTDPTMPDSSPQAAPPRRWWTRPRELHVWAALLGVTVLTLFFRLGTTPPGFYADEVSVGYNARCIARYGEDQYGTPWPLFFKAYGDYKSPLYLYAAALTVAVFGPTKEAVRLPSILYALGMAFCLFLLLRRATGSSRLARWMALLSLLVPSIYSYARHAVSEVASFPFWLTLALIALWRLEEKPNIRRALWAGVALGLCTYTYTTARMLAPLMVAVAAALMLLRPAMRRQLPPFLGAAALLGAPMGIYMLRHPGTLNGRFKYISIFKDASWDVAAERFLSHYFEQLASIDFYFRTGDHNLRHNAGVGMLPVWMAVPVLLGLWCAWRSRERLVMAFLLVMLPLFPVPASLTHDGSPHASRMLHVIPVLVIFAGLGIAHLLKTLQPDRGVKVMAAVFVLVETMSFLFIYHVRYPTRAQPEFDNGRGPTLEQVKRLRTSDEPVYLPDAFYDNGANHILFWMDVDPVADRKLTLSGLNFHHVKARQTFPAGAIVVLQGDRPPSQNPGATELGRTRRTGKNDTLWSIWRIPPAP